jgi:hypothetical protein
LVSGTAVIDQIYSLELELPMMTMLVWCGVMKRNEVGPYFGNFETNPRPEGRAAILLKTNSAQTRTIRRSIRKVETIKVHHLVPDRHEVADELLLRVAAGIGFRDGAQL